MQHDPIPILSELDTLSTFLRREALGIKDFEDALVCAGLYGRLHWDNISGFFGDDTFEQELFERWQDQFSPPPSSSPKTDQRDGWHHILTEVYQSGGHTRLFNQLSTGIANRGKKQSLIVTRKAPAKAMSNLPNHFTATTVLLGTAGQRARALYQQAHSAEAVLLYNHPDDIGTALAARALKRDGIRILFVNHADHVFSFGPGACEIVLEICATGWKTTKNCRSPIGQSFMGIPMTSAKAATATVRLDRTGPIVSVGGPGKFAPSAELSFPAFLDKLMAAVPNDVVLIGPSPKQDWWQPVLDKYPSRLHLLGVQPPEVLKAEYERASCYIDSFPMDGGTVFTEAVMSGLPAFSLNKDAALGISPADVMRSTDSDELVANVADYLQGGIYPYDFETVRTLVKQDFSNEATVDRVLQAAQGEPVPLPEYLRKLGNRSPNYNAVNWLAASQLHVPKRAWRRLSLKTKLRLMKKIRSLDLNGSTVRKLKRRILFG